jgi:hypothetical protein
MVEGVNILLTMANQGLCTAELQQQWWGRKNARKQQPGTGRAKLASIDRG